MFNKSTDGGLSWDNANPVRIKDDADTTNTQWFSTMSVAPNGRIDVIWLDTRDHPGTDSSALYYSYSLDQGESWSVNEKLSGSFNPHIGYPNQQKMGDYFDMISNDVGVHLAWVNTFNGEENVYYSFITPAVLTGVDDMSTDDNVNVFPNPSEGIFEASWSDKRIKVDVFSMIGTKIFTSGDYNTSQEVNISSRPAGMYILKFTSEDNHQTVKRVIKE